MSCEQTCQSGQVRELKCEPEFHPVFHVTEVERSTESCHYDNVGSNKTHNASSSKTGPTNVQTSSNDTPVIDLTMGDEIGIVPCSASHLYNRISPPQSIGFNSLELFTDLLEDWYTQRGRLKPPPCAVDMLVINHINKSKTLQQVFWTYRGTEEMTVRSYELEGFEHHRRRFIIVAQGLTRGPFIIQCLQTKAKRYKPPVPYHVWTGLGNANSDDQDAGFEQQPSVFKCVMLPKDKYGLTQSIVRDPFQMGRPLLASGRVSDNNTETQQSRQPAPGIVFQRALPLGQAQEIDTTASPIISPTVLQTVMPALPMPAHGSITQAWGPAIWHPGLQCGRTRATSPTRDLTISSPILPSPTSTQPQPLAEKVATPMNLPTDFQVTEQLKNLSTIRQELALDCGDANNQIQVNGDHSCNNSGSTLAREIRPTVEPFTLPAISAASPTAGDVTEALQPSLPSGKGAGRTQIPIVATDAQYASQHPYSLDARAQSLSQEALISDDIQQLAISLDQAKSNPSEKFTDHCLRTRAPSLELSEKSWETSRSSRETSYTSEMLIEAEHEFSLSKFKDSSEVAKPDDIASDCSSRKRKRESTNENMDEARKSTLAKKELNMHSPEPLFETQSQSTLKRQRSEMVSENPIAAALKDQSTPSKEAYENLWERSTKSRAQSSTEPFAVSGVLERCSGPSPNMPTSCCSTPPIPESIHGSYMEPSTETPEPKDYLSLTPSGTPVARNPLTIGGHGNRHRKASRHKTHLAKPSKMKSAWLCPICGRRFGWRNLLIRHLTSNGCRLTHQRKPEKHNTEDDGPTGTQSRTAQGPDLRRVSPSLTDHHQSAVMEAAEENLLQTSNKFGRLKSRASSIVVQSAVSCKEKEQQVTEQAANPTYLEPEFTEDDGFAETLAFPPPATIRPSRLKQHIRENVMLLFYTPAGKTSRRKPFAECDTVGKLFGQAVAAKVFGPVDERLKPDGNVLSVCFGAGQSDVGQDLRVVQDSTDDFDTLVDAIERRDWWREKNGFFVGSGILEVRAVG